MPSEWSGVSVGVEDQGEAQEGATRVATRQSCWSVLKAMRSVRGYLRPDRGSQKERKKEGEREREGGGMDETHLVTEELSEHLDSRRAAGLARLHLARDQHGRVR